jgi:AcrR family transcriptional regulator
MSVAKPVAVANNTRAYHAPRRLEQAAATRDAIITAASRLFAELGYASTTVAAIATEARVTPKSVYALADKPGLLLLAVDRAIVGDDEPVPLLRRPPMRALLAERDATAQARLAGRIGADTMLRLYPIYRAFDQAAAAEPELAVHWRDYQRRRRSDIRLVVKTFADSGNLRAGLSVDRATDTLWALLTWRPIAMLVEERGWSRARIARWIEGLFIDLLN